jgi:hypothetical protein
MLGIVLMDKSEICRLFVILVAIHKLEQGPLLCKELSRSLALIHVYNVRKIEGGDNMDGTAGIEHLPASVRLSLEFQATIQGFVLVHGRVGTVYQKAMPA